MRNKSTSLAGPPYAAIAATTSSRHLSTLGINVSLIPGSYGSAAGGVGGSGAGWEGAIAGWEGAIAGSEGVTAGWEDL